MSRRPLPDPAKVEARLRTGLKALQLDQSPHLFEGLTRYLALLQRWNRVYNLTAIRDPEEMVTLHLLDSLTLLPHLSSGRLLDVGSGGGLPGIPIALARPDIDVVMVDASAKKARFMNQACYELGLENARAIHGRVESLDEAPFEQIVSRAFSSLNQFFAFTRPLLSKEGRWLAMKGAVPQSEIDELDERVRIDTVRPLSVPGLEAERHLIIATPITY